VKLQRLQKMFLAFAMAATAAGGASGGDFNWQVVVNNGVTVPGDGRNFNSYNQPSLNIKGMVVFRARSTAGKSSSEPAHGIFVRDMSVRTPLTTIFDRTTAVPYPNNLSSTFIEPPAFPRIGMRTNAIVSRGNHQPVWTYPLSDGTETRAGTSGIYTNPFGVLLTGASKLGVVPAFEFYEVPGTVGIPFDVFPGAPALADVATIVFKGNFTLLGKSETGVYYRDLINAPAGGFGPVTLIADTTMTMPGTGTLFGSTAPPSAVGRKVVFTGLDNEDNPTKGAIYLATMNQAKPPLTALARIGAPVPGEAAGAVFNKLGEGLSFDGRFVGFWGAWGSETKTLILQCTGEGSKDLNAYCRQKYPNGYMTSVPLHQGIFVFDTTTGSMAAVAKTPGDFDDFVYWNFSGLVPGTGQSDEDGEPARWRSASFAAVSGLVDGSLTDPWFHVVFKARKGQVMNGGYVNPVDGIYLRKGPGVLPITAVVQTGMDGTAIDPGAVDPLTMAHLPVTAMGIERESFRGDLLAINVSMATEAAGWAGIYMTQVKDVVSPPCATDVTNQFSIVRSGFRFDTATQRYLQTVTITRTASGTVAGPYALAVESLSAGATLYAAAGKTTCVAPGSPYVTVNEGGIWVSGQKVTVTLQFVNPANTGISYTPAILAGATR
jgi:hypothetical protein